MGFNSSSWMAGVRKAVKPAAVKGLELAGAATAAGIRRRISVQGPPRSRPGEPPHKDSGELYGSIWWKVDRSNLVLYLISDIAYAEYLEVGTPAMDARPFMSQGVIVAAGSFIPGLIQAVFTGSHPPAEKSRQYNEGAVA